MSFLCPPNIAAIVIVASRMKKQKNIFAELMKEPVEEDVDDMRQTVLIASHRLQCLACDKFVAHISRCDCA